MTSSNVLNQASSQTLYAYWKLAPLQYNELASSYQCETTDTSKIFNYSGKCKLIDDSDGNWRLKFLTSGTLTTTAQFKTDVFLVGGGGNGSIYGGGGGGYTRTYSGHIIPAGSYPIVIGAAGKSSTAFGYEALKGNNGYYNGNNIGGGGSGGSGGGGGLLGGGSGGTDGNNGGGGYPGKGQGTTTREFGEPTGDLYASGGSGTYNAAGAANTGNGGNGGEFAGSPGGSGIVIIRNFKDTLYNNIRSNLSYSGNSDIIIEDDGNWKLRFYNSGTLTVKERTEIDIFLVGGGGAAGTYYAGGGGGYTLTKKNITLEPGNYAFIVGAGASAITNEVNSPQGGNTSALGYTAAGGYSGGYSGYNIGVGGNGGSGGGGCLLGCAGGSNGADGKAGKGQITTPGPNGETGNTREFGEETGTLYATGGSGFSDADGTPNTGNGGSRYEATKKVGAGGSGIIIIRNKR